MQKLWSKKSKRSQPILHQNDRSEPLNTDETLPEENEDIAEDISEATGGSAKTLVDWETGAFWLFLFLAIGGIGLVSFLGLQYLTAPEATPDSSLACSSQISGEWKTPLGKITFKEEGNNRVSGKYEYANFERGKVVGEITGKLSNNNVIDFDWKETGEQQSSQNGKGILILSGGCQQFYGSYGTGESTNNFGNWQGSRLSK